MASDTYFLPLTDVESEQSALIVEKGLGTVKGIQTRKVELNNNRAVIQTKDPDEAIPQAVAAIRDLGYGVDTVKQIFPVTGLTCASCAASVESMLKSQPGVVKAATNYAASTATVEYVPGIANATEFRQAIQSIGYDLLVDEKEQAADNLEALRKARAESLRMRTMYALLFSAPLVVIGMFFMNMPYANYIMWALATPVVAVFGRQFFFNAWRQAQHRTASMDTLVALSTGIAYLFSVFNTLYPQFWHNRGLHAHVYFEAAAVVIAFILLGKMLEERAKANTSSAIKKLMGLQPKIVRVVHPNGHHLDTPISLVKVDDVILVRPGEKIAVDGIVTSGKSYVDESALSGEPIAVHKQPGEKVFSGTINQKGSFQFRAEKVGGDTVLAHIIRAIQEAQGSKAPVQHLVDKIAALFVPVVIGISLLSLLAWVLLGGENGVTHGLMAMVTVLVIACPCALGLATPTAIMVGIGKGAEQGILIKDAESLEKAHKVTAIILDKTGTITRGKPEVSGVVWKKGASEAILAPVLYSLEAKSEHPLGAATTQFFERKHFAKIPIEAFESTTGKGVEGRHQGIHYYAGSERFMQSKGIQIPAELQKQSEKWLANAATVIWFANGQEALAAIAITDAIKDTSRKAIARLKSLGITPYMITGDNPHTAKAVAHQVGIKHYKAEALPSDKADFIKKLQGEGKVVAMVGDGINDGQALAQADVSIAMGKGTDIAMDVAKMTLISSDLMNIPDAISLSRKTVRTIHQNLFWAFIYNVIGLPVAAGALYAVNGFLLDPMLAGGAMALSSVSVVLNSLRLKWAKL